MTSRVIGTYEMLWDCPKCGTRGLLGKTHRHCPSCGAAQDPEKRYFPEPGKEKEVINYEYIGTDRECPYCQTPNSAKANNCANCGGPMDGSAPVQLIDTNPQPLAAPAPVAALSSKWKMIIAAVIVGFIGLCALLTWKKEVTVEVTAHRWERAIAIERFEPRRDSAWCDQMPSDAYGVSRSREQRSTRQVADGEECSTSNRDNGDGTFSRVENCHTKYKDVPVYDDRCSFTIDRWGEARSVSARGASLAEVPTWPRVTLSRTGQCIGCEREGRRTEAYYVALKGTERDYECAVDATLWARLEEGRRVPMKVRVVGGGAVCSSLK